MNQHYFNKQVTKYLTAKLISKVLNKNIDHEENNGILLDCGELHYFNLDKEHGSQAEHEDMNIFLNKVQIYANSLGYEISVFGCSNSEEINDNIYETKVKQGFNDTLYISKESSDRAETILECMEFIFKLHE